MKFKIFLTVAALVFAAATASWSALSTFYDRYETMAVQIENAHRYDEDTANAIKHATAAADVFNLLRTIMTDDVAEEAVILMGFVNEYIEQALYADDPDSAREIMKDLHNNYVGITAARLAEDTEVFPLILSLAHNRTLIVNRIYNPMFEGKEPRDDVIAFGRDWFKEHRPEIDKRIQWKLHGAKQFDLAA